jgi:DNA modification methylase
MLNPDNPREPLTPDEAEMLQGSLEYFGLVENIVVNKRSRRMGWPPRSRRTVVGGHKRIEAAVAIAMKEPLETRWVDLNLDDEATLNLALNKMGAKFTPTAVDRILRMLEARGANLSRTGFGLDEILALHKQVEEPEDREPVPTIADRFVLPPFSVLDSRMGYWQERKRAWLSLGITSEIGRAENLLNYSATLRAFGGPKGRLIKSSSGRDPTYYYQKQEAEQRLGRELATAEFERDHYVNKQSGQGINATGTSMFDPVLCELAYRWFSPPGGGVLDPFAGGSVRGVVAAYLGRPYTGIELRGEQIRANADQWEQITGDRTEVPDFQPELTPLELRDGILVKRDDLYSIAGMRGGKVRTCWHLANEGGSPKGLITAGSRQSPQVNIVAHIAERLGVPCRVHTPSGKLSAELESARAAGAKIVQHKAGRNNVIIARAREDAKKRGWREIPFGMECQEAVEQTRGQVANLQAGSATRIVMAVGSGMSLAGLLHGLQNHGLEIPVLGVTVGANPEKRLDEYAPEGWREMVELVESGLDYHSQAEDRWIGGLELDPIYEAKALPHLRDGDLLWVVGIRECIEEEPEVPGEEIAELPTPIWIEGDSSQLDELLEEGEQFDLLFSCPPYFDLEKYSKDERDISNMTWEAFLKSYRLIIGQAVERLADDRFAFWVVSEIRDKEGNYRGLVAETIRAFEDAGAQFYNDAILVTSVGSWPIRIGKLFSVSRKFGRVHQNVLVFCKGDPRAATEACGEIESAPLDELVKKFAKGALSEAEG